MLDISFFFELIYAGHKNQAATSDTNISMNGRGDVSPYSINWNTGIFSRVHLWGCNAGKGSSNIAKHIARASGSSTSAFQNYINFTSDGRPFIRWWRSGNKVWFNP